MTGRKHHVEPFLVDLAADGSSGPSSGVSTLRPHLTWRVANRPWASGDEADTMVLALPFVGPTIAYMCAEFGRLHWLDEHYLIEAVDPESGAEVPPELPGALVLTDLIREGSPLLRHWTGLEAVVVFEPCPCGRTSAWSPFVRPLP
jgi:hypothetical protein